MSTIIPPPPYSEAPHDDLAAELAKMKAMMEQMRLEKERLEMEAKRKEDEVIATRICAEKEVALRAEQQEMRELAEKCRRQQDETYKLVFTTFEWCDESKSLMASISQREIVLFYTGSQNSTEDIRSRKFKYIITNKNVFQVNYLPTGPVSYAIYTFNDALTKKQIDFLKKEIATSTKGANGYIATRSLLLKLSLISHDDHNTYMMLKKIESVIRLIPGSYKNGDWRQLDGFFGMYFNETTMELSEVPPAEVNSVEIKVKKTAPKMEELTFNIEADGTAHEWVFQGKKVYVDSDGNMWKRSYDGGAGKWMGKYNPSTKVLNTSAEEPEYDEDE